MGAKGQPRLDQLLERRDAQIIEPGDLALRERLVGHFGQRRAAPQRQRLLERRNGALRPAPGQLAAPLGHEPLETVRVEALGIEPQLVAALARHDHASRAVAVLARQRLAQAGDLHLHGLGGVGGWTLTPELVDQPLRAERLVDVQQKQGQQRPLLAPSKRDRAALVEDLQRAEDAEIHRQREREPRRPR
jgi:hypothetical protein